MLLFNCKIHVINSSFHFQLVPFTWLLDDSMDRINHKCVRIQWAIEQQVTAERAKNYFNSFFVTNGRCTTELAATDVGNFVKHILSQLIFGPFWFIEVNSKSFFFHFSFFFLNSFLFFFLFSVFLSKWIHFPSGASILNIFFLSSGESRLEAPTCESKSSYQNQLDINSSLYCQAPSKKDWMRCENASLLRVISDKSGEKLCHARCTQTLLFASNWKTSFPIRTFMPN